MFCENCGKEIANNDKFCPYCGAQNRAVERTYRRKESPSRFRGLAITIALLLIAVGGCAFFLLKKEVIDLTDKSCMEKLSSKDITFNNNGYGKPTQNISSVEASNENSTSGEKIDESVGENTLSTDTKLEGNQIALDNIGLLNRQAGAISAFGWNSFDSREFYDDDLEFWIALILEYYTDCNSNYALPVDVKEVDYVDFDPKSYSRFGCFRAERKEIDWVLNNIFHMASPVNLNIYEDDGEEIAFAYAMNEYYYIYTDGLGIVASSTVDTSIIGKGEQGDYLIKMVIDGETFILDASLEKYNGKNYWSFYSIEHQ